MPSEAMPDLYQALLDDELFAALFADLSALGNELEVSVKERERATIEERSSWTLERARLALMAGEVRAVQVRYVHEGTVWIDTILRSGSGYRVVRMQTPASSTQDGGNLTRPT